MSNFTTLHSAHESLPSAPTKQHVKAEEPQIDALASSEAQPATTSPSAGSASGKDASPTASHRCRRCGENVKSAQFHQRTVHQKRCVVVFPDGAKETLIRIADGERFNCTKCSYGHRDPQYLQIHARQKCSGQPPTGGLKPETPRRKRRKTMQGSEEADARDASAIGDGQLAVKQDTAPISSTSVRASEATAESRTRPQLEMPSIETIDRARSKSASPVLSTLQLEWAGDLEPGTSAPSTADMSSTRMTHDANASMAVDSPETSPPHATPSGSVSPSPERETVSPSPALTSAAQTNDGSLTGDSNASSLPATASRSGSHPGLKVHTASHETSGQRVAQQPTPTSSIPASPLMPQGTEDITGRFALVPAFPLQSTSSLAAVAIMSQHAHLPPRRPDEGCSLSISSSSSAGSAAHRDQRPAPHPVDAFLRGLSSVMMPPPHVAQAFLTLGYDTDELLDALARGSPSEGDWDLLEKEVLVEKRYHAWWILVKNGLRARRVASSRREWAG